MINTLFGFDPLPVVNSKVTMTLDELLQTYTGRMVAASNNPEKYSDVIWNFECGWYYTGEAQTAFENKVIDHFRFRQIGFETPGRFIFEFQKKLKEIMPYYVQLYHSAELMDAIEDPLENYSMIEESTSTGNSSSETNEGGSQTQTNAARLNKHLSTPQGRVENLTDGYMSYADKQESTIDTTASRNNSTTTGEAEATTRLTRHGNIGVTTYAQMLEGYRQTFLNIDMMIIDELDEVFLQTF
jgi:hypothetical protein